MRAEGQRYSDSSPGVPGRGLGRCTGLLPAGDVCIESRCSVGIVPEIFTELLIPPDAF